MPNTIDALPQSVSGKQLCEMDQSELRSFLKAIAHDGATDALNRVGLSDEHAVFDIRDLRDALRAFRVFRKGAWQQLGRECITGIKWLLVLTALFLLWNSPTTRKVVESGADLMKGN